MKNYLFNTTIITNNGTYKMSSVTDLEAKEILQQGFECAIGHASTAQIISEILDLDVKENRITASMDNIGDKAVCFKLNSRPKEGEILSKEQLVEIGYSFKLIERIE